MSDHTPGPWRWGFWKWHKPAQGESHTKGVHEFRPLSEMEDWGCDVKVLASHEYGDRMGADAEGEYVIGAVGGDDGEGADVDISDADMALVATSPKLLAACKELLLLVEAYEDKEQTYSRVYITANEVVNARAAIAEAQREAT